MEPELSENIIADPATNKNIKKRNPDKEIVVLNPVWLSISEASKLSGLNTKTIRRGIQNHKLKYKIMKNKYLIDFSSLFMMIKTSKKLENKLNQTGIGQYIEKWRQ